jgi:hypothetical protein
MIMIMMMTLRMRKITMTNKMSVKMVMLVIVGDPMYDSLGLLVCEDLRGNSRACEWPWMTDDD